MPNNAEPLAWVRVRAGCYTCAAYHLEIERDCDGVWRVERESRTVSYEPTLREAKEFARKCVGGGLVS